MIKPTTAPEWSTQIERWYQLDGASFALADLFWSNRQTLSTRPAWMLLASPRASNEADLDFAQNPSPAKFVHTLPNVRGAALIRLMGWNGPTLCLQKDPSTVVTALHEAMELSEQGEVWVASAEHRRNQWIASLIRVGAREGDWTFERSFSSPFGKAQEFTIVNDDQGWWSWVDRAQKSTASIGPFQLRSAQ